jgi:predicted nucleic acid-binding protein
MIVADTNLIAYLLIQGEHTERARRVYTRDPDWRAPPLWRSEFLSVLATTVKAGVLSADQAQSTWSTAVELLKNGEHSPAGKNILDLDEDLSVAGLLNGCDRQTAFISIRALLSTEGL